jgi:hypothetical protein
VFWLSFHDSGGFSCYHCQALAMSTRYSMTLLFLIMIFLSKLCLSVTTRITQYICYTMLLYFVFIDIDSVLFCVSSNRNSNQFPQFNKIYVHIFPSNIYILFLFQSVLRVFEKVDKIIR